MITVADLKDQIGPGPHPILYCDNCGDEHSANAADYCFNHRPTYQFFCCDQQPMRLVRKEIHYVDVDPKADNLGSIGECIYCGRSDLKCVNEYCEHCVQEGRSLT